VRGEVCPKDLPPIPDDQDMAPPNEEDHATSDYHRLDEQVNTLILIRSKFITNSILFTLDTFVRMFFNPHFYFTSDKSAFIILLILKF